MYDGTLSSVLGAFSSRHDSRFLGMIQVEQKNAESAFTLVEMMVVIAIIGLLAAIAMLSYAHFLKRSQAAEADMALAEVTRLEELYFSATGTYSSDLNAIGFTPNPPLQYYRVSVQAVNNSGGSMFQVTASSVSGTGTEPPISVASYASSQVPGGTSGQASVTGKSGLNSTVTSAASAGSGSSGSGFTGEGWSDEGIEKAVSTFHALQGQKVVTEGNPTSGGAVLK
jgi:type IV pilus assembly protein PilE